MRGFHGQGMSAIFLQLPQLREITLPIRERAVVLLDCPALRRSRIVGHQPQGMSGPSLAWLESTLLLFLGRSLVPLREIFPSPRFDCLTYIIIHYCPDSLVNSELIRQLCLNPKLQRIKVAYTHRAIHPARSLLTLLTKSWAVQQVLHPQL